MKKLVELSNSSKLVNWSTHGFAVLAFAAVGWLLGGPIVAHLSSHGEGVVAAMRTAGDVGGIVYFWREGETVFTGWVNTGKIKILEDNLGDLVGPVIAVVAIHLL